MNFNIIIPTHNRPKLFKKVISQLSNQKYKKFIIVVDSSYKFFSSTNYQYFNILECKKLFYHSFNSGTSFKRNLGFKLYIENLGESVG